MQYTLKTESLQTVITAANRSDVSDVQMVTSKQTETTREIFFSCLFLMFVRKSDVLKVKVFKSEHLLKIFGLSLTGFQ